LLITRPLGEQTEFLAGLRRIFFVTVPIALILAGLGGYFLARRSLAPVASMSNQAEKIGSANLNERLPVKNERDEIGNLAKVFNALLSRLERSFDQQKQFMADASHELRTPLAIVRGESEVAISKEDRRAAEYRESLTIVHDESKRLSKIVEDLFILARADSGQLKPQFAKVYLDEILVECVHVLGTLAKKRNVKIDLSVLAEIPLIGDETLLHRLFLNLLDNAIKYNREGGTVTITAQSEGKYSRVTITNTGEAIPVEDQAKIFDRFYRTDKSRNRDNTNGKNGVGLGLSIAAWIAEVHQGSLALLKSDSDGSVFQVELPDPEKK
jgi:heavy metal sensor kinase